MNRTKMDVLCTLILKLAKLPETVPPAAVVELDRSIQALAAARASSSRTIHSPATGLHSPIIAKP